MIDLKRFLQKLANAQVVVQEERQFRQTGKTAYILSCPLPAFPCGRNSIWTVLVIDTGQTSIDEVEAEAILRRLWHSEIDIHGSDC